MRDLEHELRALESRMRLPHPPAALQDFDPPPCQACGAPGDQPCTPGCEATR
jgi:hypothetical protein